MLEFAQCHEALIVHDFYRVIFRNETKINQFKSNGQAWCWARDGESQLQVHHVSQIVKHGGGAIFVWDCMTSHAMDYMCKIIKGEMTRALSLGIIQDEVMETIERYNYNPSCVIFQPDKKTKTL
jgi:hypothetical protein